MGTFGLTGNLKSPDRNKQFISNIPRIYIYIFFFFFFFFFFVLALAAILFTGAEPFKLF